MLRLNNLKTRAAMNAKISVFAIYVKASIYLLLYNLHDCTLKENPTKWLNTLKQFAENLPTNCLSVFDHFVGLALKG